MNSANWIMQPRMLCMAGAILVATIPVLSQESKNSWTLVKDLTGVAEVSSRSEITVPKGSGFAILNIRYQAGDAALAKADCKCVVVPVIVSLIVESPKRLPTFPFEKYDGPVDKTSNELMRFEVAPEGQGRTRTVKVMPNGFYGVDPQDAFVFDTLEKSVVSFLLEVRDGQKLNVMVNGPPNSIQVSFDTTGLKKLFDQVGLKAVPRQSSVRR